MPSLHGSRTGLPPCFFLVGFLLGFLLGIAGYVPPVRYIGLAGWLTVAPFLKIRLDRFIHFPHKLPRDFRCGRALAQLPEIYPNPII